MRVVPLKEESKRKITEQRDDTNVSAMQALVAMISLQCFGRIPSIRMRATSW
jgi:hypothetical protein